MKWFLIVWAVIHGHPQQVALPNGGDQFDTLAECRAAGSQLWDDLEQPIRASCVQEF